MITVISNNIKITDPTQDIISYCKKNLVIDNPDYITAKRVGRYLGNIERKIYLYVEDSNTIVLPYGCLANVWQFIKDFKYELKFPAFFGNSMQGCINLYDYQERAKNRLKSAKNGILEAPCGSGKTQIGLQLIKEIGGKALWLTHTAKLLEQSKSRCLAYFTGEFGTITNGKVQIGRDITFATVQTMAKIDPEVYRDKFDMVVVDECHHCVGSPTKVMQFYKILSNCNCRYKFGLSATLTRADNLITTLYSIIGNKIHTITEREVGNKIIKATHIKVAINLDYNLFDYIDFDGTINYTSLITMLSSHRMRNNLIVENVYHVFTTGHHKQLILCHRISQVEQLAKDISRFAKVNCITGKVKDSNREYDGDVIVATYSLAKEGLDIPTLDVLHLATPQKNESTTKQAVGRIERNVDGKGTPVCYDYVDEKIDYCVACYKKRKRIL